MFVLVLFLILFPVVNEVMEDPLGPESGSLSPGDCNEYVEIFNPGPDTVDLSRFYIEDTRERDSLQAFPDSSILEIHSGVLLTTRVAPQKFALILDAEYLLAEPPYRYPYDIPEGTSVLTTYDSDLGNGLSKGEPVFLLSSTKDTISLFPGGIEGAEGVSLERRDYGEGSLWFPSRWGKSPGKRNSWSLERELSLLKALSLDPEFPSPLDSIELRIKIANHGLYAGLDEKVVLKTEGVSDTLGIGGIMPLDTVTLSMGLGRFPQGTFGLSLNILPADEDPSDDSLFGFFTVGGGPLVINEIMFDDPVEWVELFNHSDEPLSLNGLFLEDASMKRSKELSTFRLDPGGYIVLTGSPDFPKRFPGVNFIEVEGMPALNNDKETIFLKDPSGLIIEKVCYRGKFGKGAGVSIERVSPLFDGCSEANWKPSRDRRGSTPGEKNTNALEEPRLKGSLSLSRRVLSPLEGEVLEIYFVIPFAPSTVKVRIFDVTGRRIRTLSSIEVPTKEGFALWDGRDKGGQVPVTGLYLLSVEAREKGGSRIWRRKTTLVIKR